MKTKVLLLISILCILLTGCGGKKVVDYEDIPEETGWYDTLTKEQKDYLIDECGFTQDWINLMSYENINSNLLGTGLELYNPSSGVEVNGIYYTYGEEVPKDLYGKYYVTLKNTSEIEITLEEAIEIRNKEKNIRLEDFLKYKFEIEEGFEGSNMFYFPIEGYEDCDVAMKVVEDKEGNVRMLRPLIEHKGCVFSLIYDVELFKAYANTKPNYSYDDKVITVLQPTSVTPKSMLIKLYNYSNDDITIDASFKLYKFKEDNYVELTEYAYECEEVWITKARNYSEIPIQFAKENTALQAGKYKIIIGKDEKNTLYKEVEFTIN
jgi:hypothetical protein